MKINIFIIFI